MFCNFVLNKDVRAYCGMNVLRFKLEAASLDRYRWDRLWMGFKPSLHNAARHLAIATEFSLGDPLDDSNAFFWDEMKLNLLCSPSFNPGMPWLYKFDSRVEKIASNVVTFIDNKQVTGSSVESCW